MDKQALKKHHFWILLGLAVVLIPVVLSGAVFSVGGSAAEEKAKIDKKLKDLDGQKAKGKDYREKLDEYKVELEGRKKEVWKQAYNAQGGVLHWPAALDRLNGLMVSPDGVSPAGLYFGDPIDDRDRAVFRTNDVYLAEYDRLPDVIAPSEFADKSWQKVLRHNDWATTSVPSSEEVWLALEDLCVEREVLRDVHAVNQMLAEFLPVPVPPRQPAKPKGTSAGEEARYQEELKAYATAQGNYTTEKDQVDKELKELLKPQPGEFAGRFISPYWRLDLAVGRVVGGKGGELRFRGRLTNTSGRRQNVARIEFKVWLRDPSRGATVDYATLPVQAEYLADNTSVDFDESRIGPSDPSLKVYKVEQKLDTRYVPVKRVDKLELGYPSHRFANRPLVATSFSQEVIAKAPPPPTADAAGGGGGALGGVGGPGGGAADVSATPNGLPRLRYVERTEQVRRMPVGLVLIVDQAHVQDVLRALSNSRLRFQNTQVHYQRFRGVINLGNPELVAGAGPDPAADPAGPGRGAPAGGRLPPGRGLPPGFGDRARGGDRGEGVAPGFRPGPGGAGRPPFTPPGGAGAAGLNPSVDEEGATNLVELTVYGLISLYEQFPPKAAAAQPPADAAGQPPTAAPPAAAPPGAPVPLPPGAPVPPPAAPGAGGLPPPAPTGPNPTGNPPPP